MIVCLLLTPPVFTCSQDRGDPGPLTAYKSLVITVADADDQTPAFVYPDCHMTNGHCSKPYYQAAVKCGYTVS